MSPRSGCVTFFASISGVEIADPEEAPAPKARGKGKRKAGNDED